jgi:II/X family phage/plasmid replication protein
MIDTIRLSSPPISEELVLSIEQFLERRSCDDLSTGERKYEFTSGGLLGSYDNRINVQIEREEWVYHPPVFSKRSAGSIGATKGQSVKESCEPYLVIEGSVHKAMMGHNIFGGACEFFPACSWFLDELSNRMSVELPSVALWRVLRVDIAEAYDLGSYEAVQEVIQGLNSAEYPRRKVVRFGSESLHSAGRTSTVKAYHKGPEFSKHDRKRLSLYLDPPDLFRLQSQANDILRLETSIKTKKLVDDFGSKPFITEVSTSYLEQVHDTEVARLLSEGKTDMDTVRNNKAVMTRLQETYNPELASRLFGTWLSLAALGEDGVKKSIKRSTFYLHKKQLQEAGVSWLSTDIYVKTHTAIPEGFSLTRSDSRRLTEESFEVRNMLRPYQKYPLVLEEVA